MDDKLKGGLIAAAAVAAIAGGGAAIAGATGNDANTPEGGAAVAEENEGGNEAADANESGNEGSAGENEAGKDDGNGQPVTGSPLDRASAVALDQTGGGKVTGSEINDEEGAYEIEVTQADGSQTDVHLDGDFNVIDAGADAEGEG